MFLVFIWKQKIYYKSRKSFPLLHNSTPCFSHCKRLKMKAFVRGLIARANLEMPKIQRKWAWKESAGFGGVTPPPPPPEKGLENLTVADVLLTKDTDGGGGGKVDTLISCRTNDTVFDAVKNVRSLTPFVSVTISSSSPCIHHVTYALSVSACTSWGVLQQTGVSFQLIFNFKKYLSLCSLSTQT